MGSSRLWGKIIVLIAVCGWALSAQAKYSGGSGTEAEPYRISAAPDWQELMATPADWDSHFVLTADIDLKGVSLTPIAPDTSTSSFSFQGTPFTGVFDGNDYVIRNADVNIPGGDYVALFGYLGTGGQIKNLGVEDISIRGRYYVAGLAGGKYGGTISNCYSSGTVSGLHNVAGLVGWNYEGPISESHSTGSVSGNNLVGGLVGHNGCDCNISNCYSSGPVSGTGSYVGGLVGENGDYCSGRINNISRCYSSGTVSGLGSVGGLVGWSWYGGTISDCYSTGSVSGTHGVGGLVGTNGYSDVACEQICDEWGNCWDECWDRDFPAWIYNCYSTGEVFGGSGVGGLVGEHVVGEVGDSFWDIETSEQSTSDGGTPKTTVEMMTESTFTSVGWDFAGESSNGSADYWIRPMGEGYPQLSWQSQNFGIYDIRVAVGAEFTTISWRTANYSSSFAEYGPTSAYGYNAIGDPGTIHSVNLRLGPGTWHYRVLSIDRAGRTVASEDRELFVENPSSGYTNITATVTGATSVVISWTTRSTTGIVDMVSLKIDGTPAGETQVSVSSPTTRHSVACTNLQPSQSYTFQVRSGDMEYSDVYSFETCAEAITNVYASAKVIEVGPGAWNAGATVGWVTGVAASSIVEYDPAGLNGQTRVSNASLVTRHTIELDHLRWATRQRYRVGSVDAYGNTYWSDWKTFTTSTFDYGDLLTARYSNLRRLSSGEYEVDLHITNAGSSPYYPGCRVSYAYLGGVLAVQPVFPVGPFQLSSGETKTISVTFPASAGTSGTRVRLYFHGYYTGSAFNNFFDGTFTVRLP